MSYTRTGFCFGDGTEPPVIGSFKLTGADDAERLAHFYKWLSARCKENTFDYCGYEAAFQGKNLSLIHISEPTRPY